jgi:hypothetical protein
VGLPVAPPGATANDADRVLTFSTIVDFALFQTPVEPFLTNKRRENPSRGGVACGASKDQMKTGVALCCFAFGVWGASQPASAASPAYCALYAREYAAARVGTPSIENSALARMRVEDQAYYRCLNLDDEPEFPTTSSYFGTEDLDQAIGGPFEEIAEGDADPGDEPDTSPPVDSKPIAAVKPATPKPSQQTASAGDAKKGPASSGLKPWSDEWLVWCKAHYKSFNATTGMVVTLSGDRRMCP